MSDRDDRRLKVCFVIPSLAGGGAERVAVQVLNALERRALGPIDVSVRAERPLRRRPFSVDPARGIGGFLAIGAMACASALCQAGAPGRDRRVSQLPVGGDRRARRRRRRPGRLRDRHADVGVPGRRGLSVVASMAPAGVYSRHAHRLRGCGPHRGDLAGCRRRPGRLVRLRAERACGWSTTRWI